MVMHFKHQGAAGEEAIVKWMRVAQAEMVVTPTGEPSPVEPEVMAATVTPAWAPRVAMVEMEPQWAVPEEEVATAGTARRGTGAPPVVVETEGIMPPVEQVETEALLALAMVDPVAKAALAAKTRRVEWVGMEAQA